MTQIGVQMRTGISQTQISKFELGQQMPTVQILSILADLYGTSLDYLVGRTNEKKPYPPI